MKYLKHRIVLLVLLTLLPSIIFADFKYTRPNP